MDDDEPTIEDLCKPLSAKVQPKSAKWATGGKIMSEARALDAARRSGHDYRKKGKLNVSEKDKN